jgi:biotin operon repressor
MTHNLTLTKPEPNYRKRLNSDQLHTLELLYKFRFSSSQQIAQSFGKTSSKSVQKHLSILTDQGFISKRYDSSYKLQGKPAAYYLLPKGARSLTKLRDPSKDEPVNIKGLYKDNSVSETFIAHCLGLLSVYLRLSAQYSRMQKFYTKSDLKYDHYYYFPQPPPDACIRLATNHGIKRFFLDIFEDTTPYFVMLRRVQRYLAYAEAGDWDVTDTDLPVILLVCETPSTQKRLRKRIAKELNQSYEDLTFATTTLSALIGSDQSSNKVWRLVDETDPDPDPQDEVWLPLTKLSND